MALKYIKTVLLLCALLISTQSAAALWTINYPKPLDDSDARAEYPIALLKLALDKTGVNYELLPSDRILLSSKALRQLRENREVNVVWSMTDSQREKDLLPIRIPIAKGLIGLRVFVINVDREAEFARVSSKNELMNFTPLQGEEWPDTKILQANGFNVATVPNFKDAYSLLLQNKGDFFPRSVIEVTAELEGRSESLKLEPDMAVYYPTAMYYFVNKSNPTLARLIETGLNRAIEDGSFEALFKSSNEAILEQLDIKNRRIYTLDNPLLPPETPLADERLWYVLDK